MRLKWFRPLKALATVLASCVLALPSAATSPAASANDHAAIAYLAPVMPHGAPEVRLHVEELGPARAGAEPLLLLHGFGASTHTWRHVAPALARERRVIAIDLRGYGLSDKPFDQRYSAADQAEHVIDFIKRRGLKRVTIAGHSFGGAVALLVTLALNRQAPGTVKRLVLLDAPAYPQEPTAFMRFLQRPVLPYALLTLVPPDLAAAIVFSAEANPTKIGFDDIMRYAEPFHAASARHALISTARQLKPANWRQIVAHYPSIHQPTLLIWCDADDVVPISSGQRLERVLPNARLKVVRGCKHSPQDERPEALLPLLQNFLR